MGKTKTMKIDEAIEVTDNDIEPMISNYSIQENFVRRDKFDEFCGVNAESMKQLALEIRELQSIMKLEYKKKRKRNWQHKTNHKLKYFI